MGAGVLGWRALDPRRQWRYADTWTRVTMIVAYVAAAVVLLPWPWGGLGWVPEVVLIGLVAVIVVWSVRECVLTRRVRRVFDEFIAEIKQAGGYERLAPERHAYWIGRLRQVARVADEDGARCQPW